MSGHVRVWIEAREGDSLVCHYGGIEADMADVHACVLIEAGKGDSLACPYWLQGVNQRMESGGLR